MTKYKKLLSLIPIMLLANCSFDKTLDSENIDWDEKIIFDDRSNHCISNSDLKEINQKIDVQVLLFFTYYLHPNYETWIKELGLKRDDEYESNVEKYRTGYFKLLNTAVDKWIDENLNFNWDESETIYALGPFSTYNYDDFSTCSKDKIQFNSLAKYDFIKRIEIISYVKACQGSDE